MKVVVRCEDREETVTVTRAGHVFEVRVGESAYSVDAAAIAWGGRSLIIDGRQFEVTVRAQGEDAYQVGTGGDSRRVEILDPLAHLAEQAHREGVRQGRQRVVAYMPGRVVAVLVEEGAEVAAGQGLVVLEAMKMENEIQADRAGVVRNLFVSVGQAVDGGDPLFEIE